MSRGLGALQRQILLGLQQRGVDDRYYPPATLGLAMSGSVIRARWRWYTIELLGLVDIDAAENARATVNQAINTLARRGHVRTTRTAYPYSTPFAGYSTGCGDVAGTVDLAELHHQDPRWPTRHGRRLWFRLPPPPQHRVPPDDQLAILGHLERHRPDEFEDFAATLNRGHAWRSPVGQLLAWLLCGSADSSEMRLDVTAAGADSTEPQLVE